MPLALPIPADLLDLRRGLAELDVYAAEVETLRREQYPDPDQTDIRDGVIPTACQGSERLFGPHRAPLPAETTAIS